MLKKFSSLKLDGFFYDEKIFFCKKYYFLMDDILKLKWFSDFLVCHIEMSPPKRIEGKLFFAIEISHPSTKTRQAKNMLEMTML
jgi:hypothetical protein